MMTHTILYSIYLENQKVGGGWFKKEKQFKFNSFLPVRVKRETTCPMKVFIIDTNYSKYILNNSVIYFFYEKNN